ncbi:MAG: 50S ribosomal protein L15 [Acidobacteriota bacterium]
MSLALPSIVQRKKRLGRGTGSRGAKSGRGMKGQKSRAGFSRKAGFEGGQTPLYMRLPKGRGTKQKFPSQIAKPVAISVARLNLFEAGTVVGPGALRKAGFVSSPHDKIKLIGQASLAKKMTVRVHYITKGARASIEKSGGKVELIV